MLSALPPITGKTHHSEPLAAANTSNWLSPVVYTSSGQRYADPSGPGESSIRSKHAAKLTSAERLYSSLYAPDCTQYDGPCSILSELFQSHPQTGSHRHLLTTFTAQPGQTASPGCEAYTTCPPSLLYPVTFLHGPGYLPLSFPPGATFAPATVTRMCSTVIAGVCHPSTPHNGLPVTYIPTTSTTGQCFRVSIILTCVRPPPVTFSSVLHQHDPPRVSQTSPPAPCSRRPYPSNPKPHRGPLDSVITAIYSCYTSINQKS